MIFNHNNCARLPYRWDPPRCCYKRCWPNLVMGFQAKHVQFQYRLHSGSDEETEKKRSLKNHTISGNKSNVKIIADLEIQNFYI